MDSFEKDALRAQIRQAKRALTPAQIASASAELAAALRRHPLYRQARSLYGYLSYNQEVETHALLLQAQRLLLAGRAYPGGPRLLRHPGAGRLAASGG